MLAPIVLFVYNRPWHTEQMLMALTSNELASKSSLYVYCDGPKKGASELELKNIYQVRSLIHQQKWCDNVNVKAFDENVGCRNIIIQGVSEVVSMYGKVIVLEDDIITSPTFLNYMNAALEYYESRKTVFSISGHSHSPEKYLIPTDYEYDVYVSPRIFNWGWGTWHDRWIQTDWSFNYYSEFIKNKFQIEAFNRCGDDLTGMLTEEYDGKTSAWDIQFTFAHFMNHAISIIPCIPFTRNIGLDGSGTHCSINHPAVELPLNISENFKFLDVLYEDKRIINSIHSSFLKKKRPILKKIINRITRIVLGKSIFVLKSKVYK
jgi:hypothetical protein